MKLAGIPDSDSPYAASPARFTHFFLKLPGGGPFEEHELLVKEHEKLSRLWWMGRTIRRRMEKVKVPSIGISMDDLSALVHKWNTETYADNWRKGFEEMPDIFCSPDEERTRHSERYWQSTRVLRVGDTTQAIKNVGLEIEEVRRCIGHISFLLNGHGALYEQMDDENKIEERTLHVNEHIQTPIMEELVKMGYIPKEWKGGHHL